MSTPARDVAGHSVVFYNVENGATIASMPIASLPFVPRAGETVALTMREGAPRKFFQVVEVIYDFAEAGGQLKLLTVSVDVKDMGIG